MPFFDTLEMQPDDPILGLSVAFAHDQRSDKANLGVGAYKNAEGKPQVLSCVRKAEAMLLEQHLNKEYQPIPGNPDYIQATLKLIFGEDAEALAAGRIFGAQTLGGTGALRIGGEFLVHNDLSELIFLSDPTWPNHQAIFTRARIKIDTYIYYDERKRGLNFTGMCESIQRMPPGQTILLQPCCHNPTGFSPTFEQWKELSTLIMQQKLLPFFDIAYQGFDTSLEEDTKVIRHFVDKGHEMLVASSFSKNMGLYGERVGLLAIVAANQEAANRVGSQAKQVIRGNYSMPPLQGARIVSAILQSQELRREWKHELANMRERIFAMRQALVSGLQAQGVDGQFGFLAAQRGMFSYSGLNSNQVHRLQQEYGVYMPRDGRINIAGINLENLGHIVTAILSVQEI